VAVNRAPEADHIRLQLLGFGKQGGDRHVPGCYAGPSRAVNDGSRAGAPSDSQSRA
jgi:hypothetical protein